ncbi:MAG: DUF4270 family protein [Bacteroidales bacterium]|nr:DUF4270 family protein [Bacteroidales bacterium]
MQKNTSFLTLIISALLFVFFSIGCKKENSHIGLDVQPGGDRVYIENDSLLIFRSYIELDDSVSTSNLSYNLLGSYSDPVFGKTKSEIICQLNLPSNNVDFSTQVSGSPLVANSLKLYLDFIDFYGKGTDAIPITIYRINETLNDSITYYSNYTITQAIEEVGAITFTPEFDADGFVDTVVEIELDINLATELLTADTSNYVDDEAFTSFFKGFYISVGEVENGGLISCNMLSSLSGTKMTLEYNDSLSFNYLITNTTTRFNLFSHSYDEGSFSELIDEIPDSLLFIQCAGGTHTRIAFENYEHWQDSSIAVLKAEIILPVATSYAEDEECFPAISRLLFTIQEGENTFTFPYDYNIDGSEGKVYFNGYLDEDKMEYRFNVTRYFQSLISGETSNNTIKLFPQNTKIIGNKIVLDNGANGKTFKLSLTYTKL